MITPGARFCLGLVAQPVPHLGSSRTAANQVCASGFPYLSARLDRPPQTFALHRSEGHFTPRCEEERRLGTHVFFHERILRVKWDFLFASSSFFAPSQLTHLLPVLSGSRLSTTGNRTATMTFGKKSRPSREGVAVRPVARARCWDEVRGGCRWHGSTAGSTVAV